MRTLFFVLLLANLAFFGWARWIDAPPAPAPTAVSAPTAPPLQRAPAAAITTAAAAAAATESAPAPMRCRSIGPFADAAAAGAAAALLRSHGWQPRQRSIDTSAPDGYWVYIGDLKDSAAQRGAMARLNKAGIHDAATMTQSDQMDRVSVGVFADQTHAVRRAEQVRQLGFKPILDVHQRTVSEHWLDVDLKPSDPDPQPAEFQSAAGAGSGPGAPTSGTATDASGGLRVANCAAKAAGG